MAVLLHGWPYDIHSHLEVAPLLAAAGYRVVVPYLRGFGTTRFLGERPAHGHGSSAESVERVMVGLACPCPINGP